MVDAGHDDVSTPDVSTPRTRRPASRLLPAVAALLLLGGGAAVAAGLLHQDPTPPAPRAGSAGTLKPGPPADSSDLAAADESSELRPVGIRIPAIKVSSPLTVVGQRRDGTLQVPQPGPDYDKAAWFKGSPAPGQPGPAVIEGHVDGEVNGPSVFFRLGALEPGNEVLVTRTDGSQVRFVVYAVRTFPKDDFPQLQVYGNTPGPELRLITCGGPYDSDREASGYTSNVVVFARAA